MRLRMYLQSLFCGVEALAIQRFRVLANPIVSKCMVLFLISLLPAPSVFWLPVERLASASSPSTISPSLPSYSLQTHPRELHAQGITVCFQDQLRNGFYPSGPVQ